MALPSIARDRVQGSVAPIGMTLVATATGTLADLTGGTVTIEVYGGTRAPRTGWTWATITDAQAAGDPIVGTVTPPAGAQGLATAREVVEVLFVVTLPGQAAREVGKLYITTESRTGP